MARPSNYSSFVTRLSVRLIQNIMADLNEHWTMRREPMLLSDIGRKFQKLVPPNLGVRRTLYRMRDLGHVHIIRTLHGAHQIFPAKAWDALDRSVQADWAMRLEHAAETLERERRQRYEAHLRFRKHHNAFTPTNELPADHVIHEQPPTFFFSVPRKHKI